MSHRSNNRNNQHQDWSTRQRYFSISVIFFNAWRRYLKSFPSLSSPLSLGQHLPQTWVYKSECSYSITPDQHVGQGVLWFSFKPCDNSHVKKKKKKTPLFVAKWLKALLKIFLIQATDGCYDCQRINPWRTDFILPVGNLVNILFCFGVLLLIRPGFVSNKP